MLTETLVTKTFKASDVVKNQRNIEKVLTHLTTEVGELAQEVQIAMGDSYKEHDKDGVVGESVDVILCVLDLIKLYNPDITEQELINIATLKIAKWVEMG